MSFGRKKIEISLNGIAEILEELNMYDLDETVSRKSKKTVGNKKIYDLSEFFWDKIRENISKALISNYNKIKIINSPKYSKWKKEAKDNGVSVKVTTSGNREPVIYIKGSLRTGFLRERIRQVQVKNKRIDVRRASTSSIQYTVDISDLIKNYGRRFAKRVSEETGQDLFVLTDQQINEILEDVLSNILSNN